MRNLLLGLLLAAALLGCGGGGSSDSKKVASVSVIPAGEGKYTIQGENMDSVAGIDATVTYDNSYLSSPSVDQGSLITSGLFAVNPNQAPNAFKIAVVSPKAFTGSGPIAHVTFSTLKANAPTPTVTCKLVDVNGGTVSGQPLLDRF